MSYISALKNLKLTNISFISPITFKIKYFKFNNRNTRNNINIKKNKINTPQQISNTNLNSPKT